MASEKRQPRQSAEKMKEATARIKINKLLEAAGWCFFPGELKLNRNQRSKST